MPPFTPKKRPSAEPALERPAKRVAIKDTRSKRQSVFDAAEATKPTTRSEDQHNFLQQLEDSVSESSSSSDAADVEEYRLPIEAPSDRSQHVADKGTIKTRNGPDKPQDDGSSSEEDEEDEEGQNDWDDYLAADNNAKTSKTAHKSDEEDRMQFTVDEVRPVRLSDIKSMGEKKGPTKVERQIRTNTHQLHVMSLMHHNHIRNHWLNDKGLQASLVEQLPGGCKDEIERWRKACGDKFQPLECAKNTQDSNRPKQKDKGKAKPKPSKASRVAKNIRDWGPKAEGNEDGNPNLSHGDPTLRMLKAMSAFWRKRFNKSAPGIRKSGYKDMERIQDELNAFRKDAGNKDEFGEHIEALEDLLRLSQRAKGSRDVGAQLFTAMLRGLGLSARMVASLQPAGFGWGKGEEANPARKVVKAESSDNHKTAQVQTPAGQKASKPRKLLKQDITPSKSQPKRQTRSAKGKSDAPINLSDDEDSPLSDPPSSESDDSVVDVTLSRPLNQSQKRYDGDLNYPHYWTEVLSPITDTWIPVDPICLSVVASNADSHAVFEPRGTGADRNKQVLAYVIAHNADGGAKDVTTRYLKRHMWPGKTKGVRYPIEKIPLYNSKGKIIRHEQYDWFKDVLSLYRPPGGFISEADKLEDSRELKPAQVTRSNVEKPPQESLQYYKTSAEYVLQRHLRREEALLPDAAPVKQFTVGKGDKTTEEPVFKRSDVVACKSSESWHKEGREVKMGEQPLKRVPMRAVTALRKAEVEQVERETGVKAQQALFSKEQTDWIIPSPIVDGIIPKNAFGNMDVYVPTMVPQGAVHVPNRGTVKICKKLGIDFAEACTGFEFGKRIAVPILTGVVVAAENQKMLVDAWKEEEIMRKEKERRRQEKVALSTWRKFFAGLKVVERVRAEYGLVDERELHQEMEEESKVKKGGVRKSRKGKSKGDAIDLSEDDVKHPKQPRTGFSEAADDLGGGFLPEGMGVELHQGKHDHADDDDGVGGGFVVEDEEPEIPKENAFAAGKMPMKSLREQAAKCPGVQPDETDEDFDDQSPSKEETNTNSVEWMASQEGVMQAKAAPRKRGRPRNGKALEKEGSQETKKKQDGQGASEDAEPRSTSRGSSDEGSEAYNEPPRKKRELHVQSSNITPSGTDAHRRRSGRLR